ncbi:MAG: hypothetical protein JWO03_3135 [Bacteroidetes bacterium]|nr:hypothetical protein [Bacteroidota bacterium]
MDISLEKQRIKQELDLISDEGIILTIKKILGLVKDKQLSPLTREDIIARALNSEEAIAKGKFVSLEELETKMKNW